MPRSSLLMVVALASRSRLRSRITLTTPLAWSPLRLGHRRLPPPVFTYRAGGGEHRRGYGQQAECLP